MIDEINSPPVIVEHDGIFVVRDDMIDGGSKSRFIQSLIKNSTYSEFVYGSSPATGYAQISLAKVCSHYGKKATLFMAKRNLSNLHPYQLTAIQYGANIQFVANGMLSVTEKRARDYVAEDNISRKYMPIGFQYVLAGPSGPTLSRQGDGLQSELDSAPPDILQRNQVAAFLPRMR